MCADLRLSFSRYYNCAYANLGVIPTTDLGGFPYYNYMYLCRSGGDSLICIYAGGRFSNYNYNYADLGV